MSITAIITSLANLSQLHESLVQLSLIKTDLLKKGNTEELQLVLKKEQKHVQAINQVEARRLTEIKQWATDHQFDPETMTVTFLLEKLTNEADRIALEQVTTTLAGTLVHLKQQEALNKELTEQSLQFIQMSIDMAAPSIQNINYGNQKKEKTDQTNKRSVFDSKA
jgi:hypothetical protein